MDNSNSINRQHNLINIILIVVFAICMVGNSLRIFSIISLVVFIAYLIGLLYKNTIFYIKYFYIVFVIVATTTSCAIIEFNSFYLTELRVNSEFVGSLPLLILAYFIMIETILFMDKKYRTVINFDTIRARSSSEIKIFEYISYITLLIIVLCFAKVFLHPSFLVHMERADYAKYYGVTGFLSGLATNIPRLLVFPFFLMIATKGRKRVLGLMCLVFAGLYFLWIGNKFGAFFQIMYIFLIVLSDYINSKVSKRILLKYIKRIGLIFGTLIIITLVIQSVTYNGLIKEYFFSRIASEGELWWATFGKSEGTIHLSELGDELQSFSLGQANISDNVGSSFGIYKNMYYCAPASVVNSILSAGYRYTESGFACAFYYLGHLGAIFYAIFMGTVFSFLICKLSKAINEHKIFRTYIYIRFLLYATTAFSMFIFTPFLGFTNFILYAYLIATHRKNIKISIGGQKVKI